MIETIQQNLPASRSVFHVLHIPITKFVFNFKWRRKYPLKPHFHLKTSARDSVVALRVSKYFQQYFRLINKKYNSYEKNSQHQSCIYLWNKQFCFPTFFPYFVYFGGKIKLFILRKTFLVDKRKYIIPRKNGHKVCHFSTRHQKNRDMNGLQWFAIIAKQT